MVIHYFLQCSQQFEILHCQSISQSSPPLFAKEMSYNKVKRKVTLSFICYPLFQWYPQSREILLNLSMKCWDSAFNAQGSIVVVQVGEVKIYVVAVEALREKGKRGMKLSLPPKLVEKLVWVPVISFCKISFPVTHLMPYYSKTGRSRPLIAWLQG